MKRTAPSRSSPINAGWACVQTGTFRELAPLNFRRLSWLSPGPLIKSRNDKLARWFGDPTNHMRRAWMARLGNPTDLVVRRYAERERISFAVLGDTGEGDLSQYAVVPVLARAGAGTEFAVLCSDVIYPAGGIRSYRRAFYQPYSRYPAPIYALPGNHDWYDGLTGFMTAFCDAPVDAGVPPLPRGDVSRWRRALRRLLWRRPPRASVEQLADMRWLRDADTQQAGQPGPYCAIDAGPVLLVMIDTGITGGIDADQAAWLRRVSRESPKPKILLTGRPLYTYAYRQTSPIEALDGGDAGDVNDIVTDPAHNYIAAIGGDDHNYQRYPVRLADGRTVQYIVNGGGGAYLSATHQIPNIDRLAPAVTEDDFRCYPLRGDSLAHFSRRYDRILGLGLGRLVVSPADATALMAERIGVAPARRCTPKGQVSDHARWAANRVFPLPGRVNKQPQNHGFSVLLDSDSAPMFKSFLRVDAGPAEIVIYCWAATGCLEHEENPVLEDRVRARLGADGRWCWTSETPARP